MIGSQFEPPPYPGHPGRHQILDDHAESDINHGLMNITKREVFSGFLSYSTRLVRTATTITARRTTA